MTKNKAIVFIHKDRFEYYDQSQSRIFQFVFQPNIIQDLEVVDKDQINVQIKSFVETNKLQPADMLFVIANVIIFEKIFPITASTGKDSEIQKFLENIPFEHVSYKVIDGPKDYKVQAINKELYSVFKYSFESFGFKALGVIPQSALGEMYINSQNLSPDIVRYILTHFDSLQKQSFIQEEIKSSSQAPESDSPVVDLTVNQKAPNSLIKYRLPVIISVFVILIGVLSFVVYQQYTPKSKASPVPSTIVAPPIAISPTPTADQTPPSSPSAN